jgi:hypothetical protein
VTNFLTTYDVTGDDAPESLIVFLKTCSELSLPRNCRKPIEKSNPVPAIIVKELQKGIKLKKRHEIEKLSQLVSQLCESRTVLDIGSGQGHLARQLSFGHGLNVICLEQQKQLSDRAKQLDRKLINRLRIDMKTPEHVNYEIKSSESGNGILEHLKSLNINVEKVLLVGLHTCGDLGPTLLNIFCGSPQIKSICLVGCCYMKLSSIGFPLSKQLTRSKISYEARELACHALEAYLEQANEVGRVERLKIHAYRAALEKLIVSRFPRLKRLGLKGVKNAHKLSFDE